MGKDISRHTCLYACRGAAMPAFGISLLLGISTICGQMMYTIGGEELVSSPALAPQPVPAKIARYAQRVVRQYDRDGDGRLGPAEYQTMAGQPARADTDRDGVITPEEFARYVAGYAEMHKVRLAPPAGEPATLASVFTPAEMPGSASAGPGAGATGKADTQATAPKSPPPAAAGTSAEETPESAGPRRETRFFVSPKRLPPGLPDWFVRRDEDGDGQLTLAEFAPRPTPSQLAEFARLDLNRDGIVTPRECLRAMGKPAGGKPAEGKTQKGKG